MLRSFGEVDDYEEPIAIRDLVFFINKDPEKVCLEHISFSLNSGDSRLARMPRTSRHGFSHVVFAYWIK